MTWKIDEISAVGTVRAAHLEAEQYALDEQAIATNVESLLGTLGKSEFVYASIMAWVEQCGSPGVTSTRGAVNVAIDATSRALELYHEGQLAMAANAQSMAAAADYPTELPKADGSANPVPEK